MLISIYVGPLRATLVKEIAQLTNSVVSQTRSKSLLSSTGFASKTLLSLTELKVPCALK